MDRREATREASDAIAPRFGKIYGRTANSGEAAVRLYFLEIISVDLRVLGPLLGKILEGEDGGHRANRHASAAVNALVGIDVKLLRALELRLVFSRVNAIDGATSTHALSFVPMQGSAIT